MPTIAPSVSAAMITIRDISQAKHTPVSKDDQIGEELAWSQL
jgi:hypothetical protein